MFDTELPFPDVDNEISRSKTPDPQLSDTDEVKRLKSHVQRLEHSLFFLWAFLFREDVYEEASDFLDEHLCDEVPFSTYSNY